MEVRDVSVDVDIDRARNGGLRVDASLHTELVEIFQGGACVDAGGGEEVVTALQR